MNPLPAPPPPLTESYLGSRCWVCGEVFSNQPEATSGNIIRNEHHVVPRAYGGLNGPVVALCSAHHDLLHEVADLLTHTRQAEAEQRLSLLELPVRQRVLYLSNVVVQADYKTRNDPNRRGQIALVLEPQLKRELEKLAKLYGVSRDTVIKTLIHQQYTKEFPIANTTT